jgi:hypothetical protein
VLQTTAGKMIFGRFDDRVHHVYDKAPMPPPERGHERANMPQPAAPTTSAVTVDGAPAANPPGR